MYLVLGGNTLSTTSALGTSLLTTSLSLGGEKLHTSLLSLGLVNMFHQDTLVLELVTLALKVQLVVQVTVDLGRFSIFSQETTEDSHTTHPDDLGWETSLAGTSALTHTGVTTKSLSSQVLVDASTGVDSLRLADDETILDQFTKVLTYNGERKE